MTEKCSSVKSSVVPQQCELRNWRHRGKSYPLKTSRKQDRKKTFVAMWYTLVAPKIIRLEPIIQEASLVWTLLEMTNYYYCCKLLLLCWRIPQTIHLQLFWKDGNNLWDQQRETLQTLTAHQSKNFAICRKTETLGDMKSRCSDKVNDLVKNDTEVVYRPVDVWKSVIQT